MTGYISPATSRLIRCTITVSVSSSGKRSIQQHRQATSLALCAADLDSLLAARLVGAIMDLEHRALEAHMEQLWPLIWQAAEVEASGMQP